MPRAVGARRQMQHGTQAAHSKMDRIGRKWQTTDIEKNKEQRFLDGCGPGPITARPRFGIRTAASASAGGVYTRRGRWADGEQGFGKRGAAERSREPENLDRNTRYARQR